MSRTASELLEELGSTIEDERVLQALSDVPRDLFVPSAVRDRAWENLALPIDAGQTISQPSVVARMCQLLELDGSETVLDVGTGSGYHAAVLSRLAAHVYSIERRADLSRAAHAALAAAGIDNVTLLTGDGTLGHPEHAPYDAINVAAGAPEIPDALEQQLAVNGRLIIPLDGGTQRLVLVRHTRTEITRDDRDPVRFVPLVSDEAEQAAAEILRLAE
jgi:protein-L-isoaspartate(D-aspartate) O-methyltransferase